MKKLLKVILISIIFMSIIVIKSYAAVQIVPSNTRITNVTVSTSFQTCRDMDSMNSTLGTTHLDPHLATNKDWGAVSYLAHSVYGVDAQYDTPSSGQGKIGKTVNIQSGETTYTFLSTTGNATGIMNWGGTNSTAVYSQTTGILSTADSSNTR